MFSVPIGTTYLKKLCFDFSFSARIRIGDQDLNSTHDDILVLPILNTFKHPSYDGITAYFDVMLVETESVPFSTVIVFFNAKLVSNL